MDLNEFIKNKTDISDLNELKEVIKQKDYKIKLLEEELNKYKAKDKSKDYSELKSGKNKKEKKLQFNIEEDNSKLENKNREKEKNFHNDLKIHNENNNDQKITKKEVLKKEKEINEKAIDNKSLNKNNIHFSQTKFYSFECTNQLSLQKYINIGTESIEILLTLKNTGLLPWPSKAAKLIFDESYQIKGKNIELNSLEINKEQVCFLKIEGLGSLPKGEYETGVYLNINGVNIGKIIKIKINVVENGIISKNKKTELIKQFRDEYNIKDEYTDEDLYDILENNNFSFENAFMRIIGEI